MNKPLVALTAALFAAIVGAVPTGAQGVDFPTLLRRIVPEADRFSQVAQTVSYVARKETQAIFPAYRRDEQIGVVFYATPKGYSGRIHMLTALDMEGTVKKVSVFSHTESTAYVVPLTDGSFLRQFEGVSLLDRLALLVGKRPSARGEIVAISGATDTSKPIALVVSEARKLFAEMYLS